MWLAAMIGFVKEQDAMNHDKCSPSYCGITANAVDSFRCAI